MNVKILSSRKTGLDGNYTGKSTGKSIDGLYNKRMIL